MLAHFDCQLPVHVHFFCDASPYGVGAVLAHILPNGEERPIAFASRALCVAERNYVQLDKEALAIAFGVKRFHNYVCGREFVLWTDHNHCWAFLGNQK